MADKTDEEKEAERLAVEKAERETAKKAARLEFKEAVKEALSEFSKDNAPKQRTQPPAGSGNGLMDFLFGKH